MAGKPATKEENTVGWGFYPNSNNLVLHEAETRMNSALRGGGVSNSKPHKAFRHITYFAKKLRGYKTGLT